jgi:hypothetical protein
VDGISDLAIMVDGGAGVEDAEVSNGGANSDNGTGKDDSALSDVGAGGDDGVGMYELGEAEAQGAGMFSQASAGGVVAYGDDGAVDAMDAEQRGEFGGGSENFDVMNLGMMEGGVIINQAGDGADASAVHEFQEDPGMPASAVNDD